MPTEALQHVLAKLPDAKQNGDGYMARCPAHEDKNPSLSIREGDDGRVLLKCFAGCSFDEICVALEIEPNALMPPASVEPSPTRKSRKDSPPIHPSREAAIAQYVQNWGQPGRSWEYVDVHGEVIGMIFRWETGTCKEVRPVSRMGTGWACTGMAHPRPLLYLPELTGASAVIVTEGETCADAARSLGWTATTSPHGSKSARQADWSPLAGKDVILLPDADEAGERYVRDVVAMLARLNPRPQVWIVRLPDLPEAGDIIDFVELRRKAGVENDAIRREIDGLINEAEPLKLEDSIDTGAAGSDADEDASHVSQSELIVRLALERYDIGQTETGEPFAVRKGGPDIAQVFKGSRNALRASLAREFRRSEGRTPNSSALADAMQVLNGEAQESTPQPVHLRVAEHQDSVVVDLGDVTGRVVIVNAQGWQLVDRSPVLFRRTELTGVLPVPEGDGDFDSFRKFINVSDDDWKVLRGWMIASLIPSIPHPILMLGGEQGTGKSSTARCILDVIDPSPAPLRSDPRDVEGWTVAASGSWVVCIDNVSHIAPWLSDALCKAVTGDGLVRRKLFSDSDLSVLSYRRVVVMTSIDPGALRGDLGDRLLLVDLDQIPDDKRRAEKEMVAMFDAARVRIFTGLLDLLVKVLKALPTVHLAEMPRMADFARILAAVDQVYGDDPSGLSIYLGQKARIADDVIESDPVALAIVNLVETETTWTGTASELLERIRPEKPVKGWPRDPRSLGGRLTRLAPALKATGIQIERARAETRHRTRLITIRRVAQDLVQYVQLRPEPLGEAQSSPDWTTTSGGGQVTHADCPPDASLFETKSDDADNTDDVDDELPLESLLDDWRSEVARWPEDQKEAWAERAAIMEHDAGLPREAAERAAYESTRDLLAQ